MLAAPPAEQRMIRVTGRLMRVLRLIKLVRVLRASRLFSRWETKIAINYSVGHMPRATCYFGAPTLGAVFALAVLLPLLLLCAHACRARPCLLSAHARSACTSCAPSSTSATSRTFSRASGA